MKSKANPDDARKKVKQKTKLYLLAQILNFFNKLLFNNFYMYNTEPFCPSFWYLLILLFSSKKQGK